MKTTDDKIKIRNQWFKIILISLFSMVFMFKIAVTKFTFHFSDFLAFILAVFTIGICSLFYVKVNEALSAFGAASKSLLPVRKKQKESIDEEAMVDEGYEVDEEEDRALTDSEKEQLISELRKHEEQVKRMDQVKEEIVNRLITEEDLYEEDKRDYLDYLLQKEKEMVLAKQEIARLAAMIEPAMDEVLIEEESEELHEETSSEAANVKDVVQLLGKEFVMNASLEQFNHKMREIQHAITLETAEYLKEEGLIDSYFNVTRKGLKEFRRAAKKFSYEDGMKFFSKVVQRGNR